MTDFLELETANRTLQVTDVKMFHTKAVAKWRGLMTDAQQKLGGVSSGLGFIGSPAWVIAGSVVMGAIENALSNSSAKTGMRILAEANELLREIHERGIYVPVSQIAGLDNPVPEAWDAQSEGISYMLLGEEFIRTRLSDQSEVQIRWSAVNCVRLVSA